MIALVFPGQGAQFVGMGKDLYEQSAEAKALFDQANEILGFDLKGLMFEGTVEDLQKTSVTQPAIFVHSVAAALANGLDKQAGMCAGHSLGEFSALVAAGALSFADGLRLVSIRANAMQKACDMAPSTMAAIVGMEDEDVEKVCADATEGDDIVVPANYNTEGQLVISGSETAVDRAVALATDRGARMAKKLSVNGAFHSPFMEPARLELAEGIEAAPFSDARIPVYQNVTAAPSTDKDVIKANLLAQLTAPVRWTQTMKRMIEDGATNYIESGPGNVLRGLLKRIDRKFPTRGLANIKKLRNEGIKKLRN
ncbi:MAG: ACP S-malonyltransferase [Bacteroidia bacterium]